MRNALYLAVTLPLAACADELVAPARLDPAAAVAPAPISLGNLGQASQAFGISGNGTVVGEYDLAPGGFGAFVWTQKAGMVALPSPPNSEGDWAYAVNDGKQVAGFSTITGVGQRAILWTKNVPYDLGTLAGGGGAAIARGINRYGHVVGGSSSPAGATHAMLWQPTVNNGTTGTMYDLGTLGGASSFAYALNDVGQVVGMAYTAAGQLHAFLWTPDVVNGSTGTMIDLSPSASYAEAYSINDKGEVVGQMDTPDGVRAFRWTPVDGLQVLGTFPGGGNSAALGIDRLGRIVGAAMDASGAFRPFVWTSKSGFQDLGTLGGTTGFAFATNPKGQAVGYSMTSTDEVRATLWVLP